MTSTSIGPGGSRKAAVGQWSSPGEQDSPGPAPRVEPGATPPISLAAHVRFWARSQPDAPAVTFVDHVRNPRGEADTISWAELEKRIGALAAWLAERVDTDDRVAILAPQGIDYTVAFLAAQHVGAIAVPLFPPGLPGHDDRLAATFTDCGPAVVLTTTPHLDSVRDVVNQLRPAPVGDIATLSRRDRPAPPPAAVHSGDIAYLQYTSGSTRAPAGVMISHGNVVANARQTLIAYDAKPGDGTVAVSWLPLFHDMGLVLGVAAPIVVGAHAILMDPIAFLTNPVRWLRQLSNYPHAISAAPSFAYGYTAARVTEDDRAWLRLDQVKALIDGAEPVRPATIDRFRDTFAECGLRPQVHRPSYGLAEATVLVTVSTADQPPKVAVFDRDALGEGIARVPTDMDSATSTLVACGSAVRQTLRIVDPETHRPLPDGRVGEIWLHGPNIATGYWGNAEATAATFEATLADAGPTDPVWLRTGDLGVLHDGDLYVTGRRKDLIIVDGRNHYPQDIELTVEQAHDAVRAHHVAAFSVTEPGQEPEESTSDRLVIVAERARQADPATLDRMAVEQAVRTAVSRRHAVSVHGFVLAEPGAVPRTSSGKVARAATRTAYLAGQVR